VSAAECVLTEDPEKTEELTNENQGVAIPREWELE
jgi:hypothetical protein